MTSQTGNNVKITKAAASLAQSASYRARPPPAALEEDADLARPAIGRTGLERAAVGVPDEAAVALEHDPGMGRTAVAMRCAISAVVAGVLSKLSALSVTYGA